MQTKSELRKLIAARKRSYSPSALLEMSRQIALRLKRYELFNAARTVLLYYSLSDEVSTHALITEYAQSKRILLPVVIDSSELELRFYTDTYSLRKGAFGISEPSGSRFLNYGAIDLAVIPGVAFDVAGNRLGRGRGYYDRLLKKLQTFHVPTLGICFDFQKLPYIPTEEHDIAVDVVL